MNEPFLEHDLFVRRWQLRLLVAGLTLPPMVFVALTMVLRRENDGSAIASALIAAAFVLAALILQGARVSKRRLRSDIVRRTTIAEQVGGSDA